MKNGAGNFWIRPLPIFIQVIGFLVILYALLLLVGIIWVVGVTLYMGGNGSYELVIDSGRRYYENGASTKHLLMQCGFAVSFSIISGLIFFSGFRMSRGINEKGLAEYSSLQALCIAELIDSEVPRLFGRDFYFSLIALVLAIAVYLVVRFSLYFLLKRILLEEYRVGADPSTSSG